MIVKRRNWCKGDVNNSSCGHCTVSAMVAFFLQSMPSYCLHSFSHLSFLGNYLSLWIQVSCKKRSDWYNLVSWFFFLILSFFSSFSLPKVHERYVMKLRRKLQYEERKQAYQKRVFPLFFFSLYNFFSHFFFICLINGYFSLPSIGFTTSFNLINRLVLFLGMQLF